MSERGKVPKEALTDGRLPAKPRLYVFRWNRQGRKGQTCTVTARGKLNSCRVVFADGYIMITSRNALRRAATEPAHG